jgi:penicillin amidase
LSASLEAALADLETRYGSNQSAWRWGDAHVARSEHRPFGKIAPLAKLFDIRIATPGDTFTINVGRNNFRDELEPFANRHSASLRALYDLSDLENSRFIHSTGQSGNVLSPLYRNYTQRWSEAAYLPMRMKREAVEKNKMGTLVLSP